MTLKRRNVLLISLFILGLAVVILYAAFFIASLLNGGLYPPENPVRFLEFKKENFLNAYKFPVSFASIIIFVLYAPVCSFIVWQGFEKTQTTEIVYFAVFILGCFLDGTRFILPVFGLWKTYSVLMIFIGRCVFAGRFLSVFALLFAAVLSDSDERQNIERNCALLILVAVFCALLIPLNTSLITSTCTVWWGYRDLVSWIRIAVAAVTVITILINAYIKDSRELMHNAIGYTVLISGYSLLQIADNFLFLIPAVILFAGGSFLYLKSLHSMYMWN